MTEDGRTDLDEASGKSRLIFLGFMIFLVLGTISTAIFGWFVVKDVRVLAERTDVQMRALAWGSVVHACEYGRFPTSDAELSRVMLPESIPCVPDTAGWWPVTREDALRGQPVPSMPAAVDLLETAYSSDGALAPVFESSGLPTLNDPATKELIRGWLIMCQNELVEAAADERD